MKEIPLSQGKVALVDDEDFERLSKFKWYYVSDRNSSGYAVRAAPRVKGIVRKRIYLHREVLGDFLIDHINRDGLDNRKCNLRSATHSQNQWNKVGCKNAKVPFKGVSLNKSAKIPTFVARIVYNKKEYHLGCFKTAEEAFEAYKRKAIELHGEFAKW